MNKKASHSPYHLTEPPHPFIFSILFESLTINLCEIKFSNSDFAIDAKYAADLRSKIQTFRTITATRKNVFLTLITPFGLAKNHSTNELVASEVTMEGMF